MAFRFEPLTKAHDRTSFRCGIAPLDAYLQQLARKDVERRVAADLPGPGQQRAHRCLSPA